MFPTRKLAAGACSGNGIIFDISDPLNPKRLDAVTDAGFAYWHSATFNNDGTKVIFTDEWGGGSRPRCRSYDPRNWGADAIYDIVDNKLVYRGTYKLPAPQTENENCVAHNGSIVPVPGRDIFVQAWYQGGLSVIDFTDSTKPVEIAYFDRGPISDKAAVLGGYWSTYWYDGRIYGTEIARGLDVFELSPSQHLTANEIAAAKLADQGGTFNPQQQFPVSWPDAPVVARAYMDQLKRDGGFGADETRRSPPCWTRRRRNSTREGRTPVSPLACAPRSDISKAPPRARGKPCSRRSWKRWRPSSADAICRRDVEPSPDRPSAALALAVAIPASLDPGRATRSCGSGTARASLELALFARTVPPDAACTCPSPLLLLALAAGSDPPRRDWGALAPSFPGHRRRFRSLAGGAQRLCRRCSPGGSCRTKGATTLRLLDRHLWSGVATGIGAFACVVLRSPGQWRSRSARPCRRLATAVVVGTCGTMICRRSRRGEPDARRGLPHGARAGAPIRRLAGPSHPSRPHRARSSRPIAGSGRPSTGVALRILERHCTAVPQPGQAEGPPEAGHVRGRPGRRSSRGPSSMAGAPGSRRAPEARSPSPARRQGAHAAEGDRLP